jgi:indolepyruvate ferredoxin oxidoreductase
VIAGVGGTGVVTLSALIGMAAHLEGLGVTLLDHTGLAQKYGAVVSYVRIANKQAALHAPRIASGGADLLLGGDLVVAAGKESLTRLAAGRTAALVNAQASMVGDFAREGDYTLPEAALITAIEDAAGASALDVIDATGLAVGLTGDAIGANLLLLGAAYQRGRLRQGDRDRHRAQRRRGRGEFRCLPLGPARRARPPSRRPRRGARTGRRARPKL